MNRTVTLFSLAGALALVAVLVGRERIDLASSAFPDDRGLGSTAGASRSGASSSNGSLTLQGRLSHPFVTSGQSDVFVTVDVTGAEVPGAERSPVNLAIVIDRSGSMAGEKLEHAKAAAEKLVDQLRSSDSLAVVHYGSDVKVLGARRATPEAREQLRRYIASIGDDGGTNIGAGLTAARDEVRKAFGEFKVNRIILISDGQPTEGLTGHHDLTTLVRGTRAGGVSVSAIGVGTDFNEDLMQAFAEYGAGSYGYLKDASMLAELFSKDLQRAGTQVANGVTLTFELPEGVALQEVLGYEARTEGRRVTVAMPDFSAGQTERVVAHLRLTAPAAGRHLDVSGLALAYTDLLKSGAAREHATLSAMITEKKEEVLAKRDKEAAVHVARARSAQNLEKAAKSFSEGRREEAIQYMELNQAVLDEASSISGEAAVAAERESQLEVQQGVAAAAAPDEIQNVVKTAKTRARKAYGKIMSTY